MTPEFSRMFDLSTLKGKDPERVEIAPKEAEYPALIKRLGLLGLKNVKADVEIAKDGKYVAVTGRIWAAVTQPCVLTLEPVETKIEETFETVLEEGKPKQDSKNKTEVEMDPEVSDYFTGHKIDIGEIVSQQILLALPIYPRKKGAKLGL